MCCCRWSSCRVAADFDALRHSCWRQRDAQLVLHVLPKLISATLFLEPVVAGFLNTVDVVAAADVLPDDRVDGDERHADDDRKGAQRDACDSDAAIVGDAAPDASAPDESDDHRGGSHD